MLRRSFLFVFVTLAAVGCATPLPSAPTFPDIRFANEPPIRLDVAVVEVKDEFQPSFHTPNVEHLFPVAPARAAANWARDRLQAANVNSRNRVRMTISDASVIETQLPKTEGLKGAFTTDQAQRYDARVAIRIEILDDRGFAQRTANAEAKLSRSVPEGITPNDRDRFYYDMTVEIMHDIDKELERQINGSFYPFIL